MRVPAQPQLTEASVPVDQKLTFNPEMRKKGIPEHLPEMPIGAKDEAESLGLDPAVYPTCSRPQPGVNRGCPYFFACPLSYKGKSVHEGGGPRRHAFEVVMPGKPVRRQDNDCYGFVPKIQDIEANRGAVRIIADENESYEKVEGIYVKTFVDPETDQTAKVPAKEGEYHYANVAREDMLVKKVVVPFIRTIENKDIAVDLVTASVVAKEQERIRGEAFPTALGVEVGGTPLDKRNRRGGKGKGQGE